MVAAAAAAAAAAATDAAVAEDLVFKRRNTVDETPYWHSTAVCLLRLMFLHCRAEKALQARLVSVRQSQIRNLRPILFCSSQLLLSRLSLVSFYFHDPDRKTETGETVGEAFFPTSVVKRVSPPRYLYQQPLLPQCSLES